jgi:beta-lactamase superfamily II metal-dependent hydrolase
MAGLLGRGDKSKLEIDLLKVPHHGSANNLEINFFERIIAKHYVFSGNGEHGNPERETMKMLLGARGDEDYTVHLSYPVQQIDAERKKDWQKEQTKEKKSEKEKTGDEGEAKLVANQAQLDQFFFGS